MTAPPPAETWILIVMDPGYRSRVVARHDGLTPAACAELSAIYRQLGYSAESLSLKCGQA